MKILIADPMSFIGHISYNSGLVRCVQMIGKCDVLVSESMKRGMETKGINSEVFLHPYSDSWNIVELSKKYKNKIIYHLLHRFYFFKVMKMINKISHNYDAIILSSIDIYGYFLNPWKSKNNILIVDHGIGNIVSSKLYKFCWSHIPMNNKILVFEKYIAEMVKKNKIKNNIFIVHHPLTKVSDKKNKKTISSKFTYVFGPSNSNDERFLNSLTKYTIPENIKVFIKGKNSYSNKQLVIFSGYISDEMYEEYFSQSSYILLPYKNDFNYRVSNVLLESVIEGKKVLLYNNNTLRYFHKVFPDNVILFDNVEELFSFLKSDRNKVIAEPKAIRNYSDSMIADSIKKAMGN